MMDRTVSVIITSYNHRSYLIEALDSVVAQTVRPYEIIVGDDASTDGSVEAIQSYEARYPDLVKGVFQEKNVGISQNRNAALRQASGNYVAILDGDDRYLPNNIELHLAALTAQPEAGCSYSNLYFVDHRGTRKRIRDTIVQPSGDILAYVAAGQMGLLRSMLIARDLVNRAGLLDPCYPKHDGYILSLRLARMTRYTYVFEPTAEYRVHSRGDSKTYTYGPRVGYLSTVFTEVQAQIGDLPVQERRRIETIWRYRLLRTQILADLEEGKRGRALLHGIGDLARRPGILRHLPWMFRQACRSPFSLETPSSP